VEPATKNPERVWVASGKGGDILGNNIFATADQIGKLTKVLDKQLREYRRGRDMRKYISNIQLIRGARNERRNHETHVKADAS